MPRGRYSFRSDLAYGNITSMVLAFITRNPDCSVRDIAQHLDLGVDTVKKTTERLRDQGKIKRVKLDGLTFVRFRLGLDSGYVQNRAASEGQPLQRTVSDWTPCMVRDPLIDIFFGRTTAPAECS